MDSPFPPALSPVISKFNTVYEKLNTQEKSIYIPICVLIAFILLHGFGDAFEAIREIVLFMYTCFIRPIGKTANQAERLDLFYQEQAHFYDSTRSKLLRGRKTMLKLCAAHLTQVRKAHPNKELIWVDIGGGTGWNIEQMNEYFPLSEFSQIYLIDLCEPLLNVARRRFAKHGYTNVQVLCQNAKRFTLPGQKPNQMVDLFTCSYSISMIPPFYAVLDRINEFLDPVTGVFGVVDFYVSSRGSMADQTPFIGGDATRHCGWISRWFWRQWFSFDHVELHPARRDYLEHKFGTLKCFNGRNNFIIPFIVRIPYYIWLGVSRAHDTTAAIEAFEVEAGNCVVVPPSFPELSRTRLLTHNSSDSLNSSSSSTLSMTPKRRDSSDSYSSSSNNSIFQQLGPQFALSSFHYQAKQWRVPFVDSNFSDMVRTWIYGFTWEDPYVDMEYLDLGADDSILCITSAGDNALHYAISASPKRIHAVDMNPCQGHLLELKLACIASLDYQTFWKMFGEGKVQKFRELLDRQISPFLSSHAYQFWRLNTNSFDSHFYFQGYSGKALRLAQFMFWITMTRKQVELMCNSSSIEEQQYIWRRHVRKSLINKPLIRFFLANPSFLWNALGVPINQLNIFKDEGTSVEQFAIDTLDPIPSRSLLKESNYHYRLCLMGQYTRKSCPLYLKEESFNKLKENHCKALDSFRLHTDSIVNVLQGLEDQSLTRAIVMDHLDWFDRIPESTPAPSIAEARDNSNKLIGDLDREIVELSRTIKRGGSVFWRSAAKRPWYNQRFEVMGFKVEPIHIREEGTSIDAVNMYASFYKGTKV